MTDVIQPCPIEIPESALDDLKKRLANTRWPDRETPEDWSQGIPLAYMREVVAYWASEYDWRRCEARVNRLGPFKMTLDGLGIHFLHLRSPRDDALPLVMTHGWPGSVVEFLEVIGPLADPTAHGGDVADAFHVVCPSLPGYGFSDKPAEPGWGCGRIARAWAELMRRLGYRRYVAQGGDWGALVTTEIALADPGHCAGIHLNMPIVMPDPETMADLTPLEQSALESLKYYQDWDSGYSKQQSTRPQTLGYGLVDSPAGQAAWILEKFWAWSDHGEDLWQTFARDRFLTNVMLYWLPGSVLSSARIYYETFFNMPKELRSGRVEVPTGYARFPAEPWAPPRDVAARQYNLIYYSEPPRGGHFAAMEQPELWAADVATFFSRI